MNQPNEPKLVSSIPPDFAGYVKRSEELIEEYQMELIPEMVIKVINKDKTEITGEENKKRAKEFLAKINEINEEFKVMIEPVLQGNPQINIGIKPKAHIVKPPPANPYHDIKKNAI